MQTDGQTDMTKLIVAFHNFANTPKHNENKMGTFKEKVLRRTYGPVNYNGN
jgi:hypothetical protein